MKAIIKTRLLNWLKPFVVVRGGVVLDSFRSESVAIKFMNQLNSK